MRAEAQAKFTEIGNANEMLTDPKKKKLYDHYLEHGYSLESAGEYYRVTVAHLCTAACSSPRVSILRYGSHAASLQTVYAPRVPLWVVVIAAASLFSAIQYALGYTKYVAYQRYVKHHPMYKQKEAQLQRQLDAGEITEEDAVVDVELVGAEPPKVLDMVMFQMPFWPYRSAVLYRAVWGLC